MSYDISTARANARLRADQAAREDDVRLDFLKRLDAAPFEVTDWEAQFIGSFLTNARPFSQRQRECVDDLMKKYEHRL